MTATTTLTHEGDAADGGVPPGDGPPAPPTGDGPRRRLHISVPERRPVGVGGDVAGILALLLLGFVVTVAVIGPFKHSRDQQVLYAQLRKDLANGTAPVSQLDFNNVLLRPGSPVAFLTIPAIGVAQVVVEGTTSAQLVSGPGHRRDTVLPGQSGVSLIFGRQAAYGGPFGHLDQLKPGDRIIVLTGQGNSTYVVSGLRYPGDPIPPALTGTQGRLTLVTAAGTPYLPDSVLRVDATLVSSAMTTPARAFSTAALAPAEFPMRGDRSSLFALVLWVEALLVATLTFVWIRARWGRRPAWLVGVPVLFVLGVTVSDQVALLLPNLM